MCVCVFALTSFLKFFFVVMKILIVVHADPVHSDAQPFWNRLLTVTDGKRRCLITDTHFSLLVNTKCNIRGHRVKHMYSTTGCYSHISVYYRMCVAHDKHMVSSTGNPTMNK